jgi:anti-sigma factor RsiW
MFMKTFEQKWTAWLDGLLAGKDLAEFEASLSESDKAAAEADKRDAKKLGALLKQHLGADVLTNEEFFSHQIRERIRREDDAKDRRGARSTWWSIRRLTLSGATALAIFTIFAVVVTREKSPSEMSEYLTQILNARVDPAVSPNASISMFETKKDKVTVLWVEGLQSLPADFAAK